MAVLFYTSWWSAIQRSLFLVHRIVTLLSQILGKQILFAHLVSFAFSYRIPMILHFGCF